MTESPVAQTRRMQALVSELWRLHGPRVEHHVGDLAWGRFQHAGRESEWRIRVWDDGAEPVAWAWVKLPGTLEHEIHPRELDGPLYGELLAWFEGEAERDELDTAALSTDTQRLAILGRHGYRVNSEARGFAFHVRDLDDETQPALPDRFRLRTLEPDDLERRVEIHRTVWHPSRVTVESYANVQAAWPYRADLDCVVEAPDGSLAAYCLAWLDETNRVGELEPVGTHPEHRRRGLGAAVCRYALGRLRAEGATRAIVYSWADDAATALYKSIGFREHARSLELVKRR